MTDPQEPQKKDDVPKVEPEISGRKLTEEENKKLDFFLSAPLRSADRLMKDLFVDDQFYETATFAWTRPEDAKRLFLYGVCKEVMKTCIGLMNDKEFLQETPEHF